MIHRSYYSYLNDYLQQCLGIRELLLTSGDVDSKANIKLENLDINTPGLDPICSEMETRSKGENQKRSGTEHLTGFRWRWEGALESESQSCTVLFVRKPLSSGGGEKKEGFDSHVEVSALEYCPQALELFHKLRQAMNLNASIAPYVELEEGSFDSALCSLRSPARKIIIMSDDGLQKGDGHNDWIIPDPVVLEQNPHLKRPTWELLKRWLAEV